MNEKRSDKEINSDLLIPDKDDNLQKYRKEMNKIVKDKIAFSSPFEINRYLTCSVVKNSLEDARTYFSRIDSTLSSAFLEISSELKPLREIERLKVFHNFFRPEEKDNFTYDPTQRKKYGDSFKNYIAPYSFDSKFDHFKIGNRYGQGMLLTEYPTGLEDDLIMKMFETKTQMVLSIDINPITNDEAKKLIDGKELAVESEIYKFQQRQQRNNNFSDQIPFIRKQQREIVAEWQDDVNNGDQHVFFCIATLLHTADTLEELNKNSQQIRDVAMGRNVKFDVTKIPTRQLSTLNTAFVFF